MARPKTLIDLLDELEPQVREAFRASIERITSDVRISDLEEAVRRGDAQAILDSLSMDAEYFAPLDRAMRESFEEAGQQVMSHLQRMAKRQGARVTGSFGGNDPRVAQWLAEQSSRRITEITADRREVIQGVLSRAAERGTSPRQAALDLVGRMSRVTGRREGGVIGLTTDQAQEADEAYRVLTENPREYFIKDRETGKWKPRWKRTDKRFHPTIIKAIKNGEVFSTSEASKIVARHRDILLRERGETIARTELLGTLHAAQDEALEEMKRREGLKDDAVKLEWDASLDSATRESHRALDGQTVTKGEAFVSPITNARMRYPGDTELGAPASEVIRCRCRLITRVDFISGLRDRLSPEERAAALEAM